MPRELCSAHPGSPSPRRSRWPSASAAPPRCSPSSTVSSFTRCPLPTPSGWCCCGAASLTKGSRKFRSRNRTSRTCGRRSHEYSKASARWALGRGTLSGGEPEPVQWAVVSASLFDVLSVRPALGRAFMATRGCSGRAAGRDHQPWALAAAIRRRSGRDRWRRDARRSPDAGGRRPARRLLVSDVPRRDGRLAAARCRPGERSPFCARRQVDGSGRATARGHVAGVGTHAGGYDRRRPRHRLSPLQHRPPHHRRASQRAGDSRRAGRRAGPARRRRLRVVDRVRQRGRPSAGARCRPTTRAHDPRRAWRVAPPAAAISAGGEPGARLARRIGGIAAGGLDRRPRAAIPPQDRQPVRAVRGVAQRNPPRPGCACVHRGRHARSRRSCSVSSPPGLRPGPRRWTRFALVSARRSAAANAGPARRSSWPKLPSPSH